MSHFYVQDWAGNRMAFGTFPSFEDAWGYLMDRFPEEDWQEYEVTQEDQSEDDPKEDR